MKTKRNIIISSIAVLVLAAVGYSFISKKDTNRIIAQTIAVKSGNVTTMVTATGTIEPITQVEVGTQVSGVVEKIYVDYNSVVKEGQLIAELDKTNLRAETTQAQAAYDNAVTQRNYMKTIFDRQNTLYSKQVISKSDYDDAVYNYETAKSTAIQRLSDLQKSKTNLGYANIYSPIDGVVLSKDIDEGQTVAASLSTPTLFTIAKDLREMQVEADVDEADIGEVKEGQRVTFTVDAYIGETFEGVVTQVRLAPTITSNVVTYTVVIKADNPDFKLKPGLTATISIYTLELNDVLTTEAKAINFKPTPSVMEAYDAQQDIVMVHPEDDDHTGPGPEGMDIDESKSLVWVMQKNGMISPRQVTLGASDGVNVQILSGIKAGEKIVYSLKAETPTKMPEGQQGPGDSPFMPKPPGKK
ncbi:efflux RND transporter periplasmic adaptor subunit [Formosa haliotis]|uniref:efflux RND transporter periplasmic adaptor subunit n=1 Tax=Formosa haliotis TaxID=1555194 RepID=UPI000826F5A0|nr:efflux RND transporter periplasmic adaptor subunit [Formosa haliotis]